MQHTDQAANKKGFHCVQGLINLVPISADHGTLLVRDGSHHLHQELLRDLPDADKKADWIRFSAEQTRLMDERGCKEVRVAGGVGSLFLWDSRTAHQNSFALAPGLWRWAVYVCYQPRALATPGVLKRKAAAYDDYRNTTHWPASKLQLFPHAPRTYGAPLPVFYPRLPELRTRAEVEDDVTLQLAGKKPYAAVVQSAPLLSLGL